MRPEIHTRVTGFIKIWQCKAPLRKPDGRAQASRPGMAPLVCWPNTAATKATNGRFPNWPGAEEKFQKIETGVAIPYREPRGYLAKRAHAKQAANSKQAVSVYRFVALA